ncbi:MAG TPA: alpha/beta fold hydrolase, partial [Actinomycetota bacterium]
IDDTSLWVVERGPEDGFPLLVLHGGPGLDHHEFADYLDPLIDRGIRLCLVDQRAQGRSPRADPGTWTLERHAQDVIMLARALRLPRYGVLGHSYGAFVALQNAVDYPGMTAATIVASGLAGSRWLDRIEANLAAFEPADLRAQVAASWAREAHVRTVEEFAASNHDQWPFHFADPRDPRIAEYEDRTADSVLSPDVLRHFATSAYGGIDVEDRLSQVDTPTLVLAGRHDRTCVVEAAEAMAASIPGARLEVCEHSGHMTFVEEPARFLEVVGDFLAPIAQGR